MGTPRTRHRSWRHGAPLLLLLAVLGGLVAMHGLGSHGAHHAPGATAVTSATSPVGHGIHGIEHPPPASGDGGLAGGELAGYAALCLAFLGALTLLGPRAAAPGLPLLLPRPRPAVALTRAVSACRDRAPPSLAELSINRC